MFDKMLVKYKLIKIFFKIFQKMHVRKFKKRD